MAFIDQYYLANNATFRARVEMAMTKSAIAISNEDPKTKYHTERVRYAQAALANVESTSRMMAFGVSANPAISIESSDADIEFTVNSIWNAYAGTIDIMPVLPA